MGYLGCVVSSACVCVLELSVCMCAEGLYGMKCVCVCVCAGGCFEFQCVRCVRVRVVACKNSFLKSKDK